MVVVDCNLIPEELTTTRKIRFPLNLPFSRTVPECILILQRLINECHGFGSLRVAHYTASEIVKDGTTPVDAVINIVNDALMGLNDQIKAILESKVRMNDSSVMFVFLLY